MLVQHCGVVVVVVVCETVVVQNFPVVLSKGRLPLFFLFFFPSSSLLLHLGRFVTPSFLIPFILSFAISLLPGPRFRSVILDSF